MRSRSPEAMGDQPGHEALIIGHRKRPNLGQKRPEGRRGRFGLRRQLGPGLLKSGRIQGCFFLWYSKRSYHGHGTKWSKYETTRSYYQSMLSGSLSIHKHFRREMVIFKTLICLFFCAASVLV